MYLDSPISYNHMFRPGLEDPVFTTWREKGIISLRDVYINDHLASFQELQQKFQLPTSHFFRFLQLRHFLRAYVPLYEQKLHHAALDSLLTIEPYTKGAVSYFYNILQKLNSPSTNSFREEWQRELGNVLWEEMWKICFENIHSSSINARHALIQFKVVHRLHFSPSKIFNDASFLCMKCSEEQGSLSHQFLQCPRLQTFWSHLFDFFAKAFDTNFPPAPLTALWLSRVDWGTGMKPR